MERGVDMSPAIAVLTGVAPSKSARGHRLSIEAAVATPFHLECDDLGLGHDPHDSVRPPQFSEAPAHCCPYEAGPYVLNQHQ